jgi:hypothetical protein
MEKLIKRGDGIARRVQEEQAQRVAGQLGALFGNASVDVLDAQVIVRRRGIIKRWLYDPSLRFLSGTLK